MKPSVKTLLSRAADLSGVPIHMLYGPSHKRVVCAVRAAVYHVAHVDHGIPMAQIARRVDRHHTTVMNALANENLYRLSHPEYDTLVEALRTGVDAECRFIKPPRPSPPAAKPKIGRFYTPERMEEVDRLIHGGMTMLDIAEMWGRSCYALESARRNWLRLNPHRRMPLGSRPWPVDKLKRADQMRRDGMMWKNIAHEFGLTPSTVCYAVLNYRRRASISSSLDSSIRVMSSRSSMSSNLA